MLDYRDLIELGLSKDIDTLTACTVAAAEALGFPLCTGVLIRGRFASPSAAMKAFGNTPPAFLEASRSLEMGLRDPLLTKLLARPGHQTYTQQLYVDAGAADMHDIQSSFGYAAGMSVSSHQPSYAETFLFGIDSPDPLPKHPAHLLELQASLQMIAVHAEAALKRLVVAPQSTDLKPSERAAVQKVGATMYSQRGRFCLIESVGDPQFQAAARKLRAQTPSEVVLKAIAGGHIQP